MRNIGRIYRRFNLTRRVYSVRIFFLSMALAGLILNGCGKPQGEQRSQSNSFTSTTPVEVATVQRQTLSVTKQFSGTLEGEEQANIVAKISERIIAINVHVSDAVSSGQVLV